MLTESVVRPARLQAVDLSKAFGGDQLVLDRLNLAVQGGELYCLLGAQGAGKTTALNLFLGFARPTYGRAFADGIDTAQEPVRARQSISYIGAQASLYENMTARQNVEFFTRLGADRDVPRSEVHDVMRQFGIPERKFEQKVASFPKELRVFLWLAITFSRETPIVMLDEPTAGLDSRASADLQEHLLDFRRRGKAVLLATTDVFLASQVSDRIGILKQGQKVAEHTRAQMLGQSLNELYFEYTGRPPRSGPPTNGHSRHPPT